ncbi:MAG: hypothetical protein Q7R86_03085, partial [bacterium]|nr:hypothetical protein [bacterium]
MILEQERVPEKVVLKIEPRYGRFDLNEFKVSLNGELLFGGVPGDVMSYVLAFRINCPGVVDLRFLFPDGQAALMGARRAFEMFPGDRRTRLV